MPGYLTTLEVHFCIRFQTQEILADFSEAISCHQKAVQLTPEGHTDMPGRLNNLGNSFRFALNTQEILLTSLKQYHTSIKQFSSLLRAMQICLVG
jgi:hypothetical protein